MEISFINPAYLWFLASVPLLIVIHFISLRFLRRRALLFANFEAMSRILGKRSQELSKNTVPLITRCLILFFFILAASGTMLVYEGQRTDFDFVLAIDASSSMLADDYLPNRLEAAKYAARLFVDALAGLETNVGVISFGGVVYTEAFPTNNLEDVKLAIDSIQASSAGGTDIGDALIAATNLLVSSERAPVIILLTDGQSNVGTPPLEALNFTMKSGVTAHTIGIGTAQGGRFQNISVVSKLDETTLRTISSNTGGRFFKVESRDELESVYRQLALSTETRLTTDLSLALMLIGIILLVMEWTLLNVKYRTLP
jgi:Ca-activated chloride channel family protein